LYPLRNSASSAPLRRMRLTAEAQRTQSYAEKNPEYAEYAKVTKRMIPYLF